MLISGRRGYWHCEIVLQQKKDFKRKGKSCWLLERWYQTFKIWLEILMKEGTKTRKDKGKMHLMRISERQKKPRIECFTLM